MLVPIQDIQGLVYNEYINMDNALKIVKNWDDIISKLPEGRRACLQEKQKEFDPLLALKKIVKNKSLINNVVYLPSNGPRSDTGRPGGRRSRFAAAAALSEASELT